MVVHNRISGKGDDAHRPDAAAAAPETSALRHPPVLDLPAAVGADGVQHAAVVGDQQQGAVLGLEGLLRAFEACRRASALPGIGVLALRH